MACIPVQSGVIYRTGLSDRDYDEAIEALQDAKKQPLYLSRCCTVCHDTGHTAEHCHHNPLIMARRAARVARQWRCFHCDAVFTDAKAAEDHFGFAGESKPACERDVLNSLLSGPRPE